MISLRGRFIRFLMQNRHWFRFQWKKPVIDWNSYEQVVRFREECEQGAKRFGKLPDGIEVSPVTIDGLRAEWISPLDSKKDKVIFYTHGGGYVSGSCSDHQTVVAKFVKGSGIPALLFEYRLAPEHQYPAAVDDSLTVYRWLLAQGISPSDIIIVGESAGGGLALATLLALKDQGIHLPSAAVAISPWTDLKCTGDSYHTNAKKCLSPEGTWTAFSKHYVGDNDPCLPLISPVYGDLQGLPPILMYVGGDEILRDDSIKFAQKAKDAGVDVRLTVGEGLFHCYPVMAPMFPEATQAMKEICDFIKKHVNKG